jgi:hypothetical protein
VCGELVDSTIVRCGLSSAPGRCSVDVLECARGDYRCGKLNSVRGGWLAFTTGWPKRAVGC